MTDDIAGSLVTVTSLASADIALSGTTTKVALAGFWNGITDARARLDGAQLIASTPKKCR